MDNKPTKPEHQNWKLRQRSRDAEIGPEFRFNSTLQVQRMMDTLQHNIGKTYTIADINNKTNGRNLSEYNRTNKHDFVPDVDPDHYESVTDLKEALKRDKKIHQTTYVVSPKKIMPELHRRLMFKGGQTIGLDTGAMKIKTRLFNEEFLDAQNHLTPEAIQAAQAERSKYHTVEQLDISDMEDIRLNKIRVMRNQKLNYSLITEKVLKKAGF